MERCSRSNKVNTQKTPSPVGSQSKKKSDTAQEKLQNHIKHIQRKFNEGKVPDKDDFTKAYQYIIEDDDNLIVDVCCKYQIKCDEVEEFQDAKRLQNTLIEKLIGPYYKVSGARCKTDKTPVDIPVDKPADIPDDKFGKKSEKIPKVRHFFIWSILAFRRIKEIQDIDRQDNAKADQNTFMAMNILQKLSKKDQIHAWIFAAALLKEMSKHSDRKKGDGKKNLKKLEEELTNNANKLLRKYKENEEKLFRLEEKSKSWGNTSLLKIAVESKNETFLAMGFSKKLIPDLPLDPTIKQYIRHITKVLEYGQVPSDTDFAMGFKCIMDDHDNLIAEICHNYNIQWVREGKKPEEQDAINLQKQLLYLLMGHYYTVPNDFDIEQPKLHHFFIWSLLAQRPDIVVQSKSGGEKQDMAMKIWGQLPEKDQIFAALFATALLKALARHSIDEKGDLLAFSKEFNTKAIGCIDEVYENDEKKARRKIKKPNAEIWGGRSILRFAVDSKNLDFLQHPVCKTLLEEEWMGHLSSTMSVKHLLFCLFFLVAGPMFFTTYRIPLKEKLSKREWRKKFKNPCIRFVHFFKAPVVRFLLHGITYLCFLGYFSYVLLIQFRAEMTNDDILLIVIMTFMFLEELLQIVGTYLKEKFENGSCVDCSIPWKLQFHVRNRILMSLLNTSRGIWFLISFLSTVLFITGYILKRNDALDAARIVLGFDLILLYIRSLQIFSIHSTLGPKIVMIGHMFKDLSYFIWILMVFVISYGMAAHSIMYPNSELNIEFFLNLLKRAYWNLYGELLIEELEQKEPSCTFDKNMYSSDSLPRCPTASSTVWIPIMMGFYILVSNILLLNLLIAMFSSTYERIQNDSERLWNYQRFFLIRQYKTRWWTPFFWIYFHVRSVMWCYKEKKCPSSCIENDVKSSEKDLKMRNHTKNGCKKSSKTAVKNGESNA